MHCFLIFSLKLPSGMGKTEKKQVSGRKFVILSAQKTKSLSGKIFAAKFDTQGKNLNLAPEF